MAQLLIETTPKEKSRFIFRCGFEERALPRSAGFLWDGEERKWYTRSVAVAVKLRDYADQNVKNFLKTKMIFVSPWDEPLPQLPKGLSLYQHQIETIRFAMSRNRSYLGLDPGLGKTAVAAIIARLVKEPVLYLCPPFLVRTVENEFKTWAPDLKVKIFYSGEEPGLKITLLRNGINVLILPDSLVIRPKLDETLKTFTKEKATIITDEAHRYKNSTAKRTGSLLNILPLFGRQIFMSGTPMPNRPMELYSILNSAAPECIDFMNQFDYGRRYCAGHRNDFGWDFTGASNMEELATKVIAPNGPFMIRFKKELLNLPPKIEEIFLVSADMSPRLAGLDSKIWLKDSAKEDVIEKILASSVGVDELHLATYRRLLGVEKATATIEYVKSLMAETDEKILIFAYHKDVITKLKEGLTSFQPIVISGETSMDERHEGVKTFQEHTKRRILIGNYLACGVGFTLTKATRVIFCEFDWVPGVNQQASDRAHRIGQKNSVLVQYVAYKDSIDKAVIETLLRKQRSIKYV